MGVVWFVFWAASVAAFSSFLGFCMQPGNIFSFWGYHVHRLHEKRYWVAKPLGACVYCMNVWIGFACFLWLFWGDWELSTIPLLFAFTGLSYVFLCVFEKWTE